MPGATMFDDGPDRPVQPSRFARPDQLGIMPVWNQQSRAYEYPADPRLLIRQQQIKSGLLQAILAGPQPMGSLR